MYKVFISGPYSQGDIAINVKTAMDIAYKLMKKGYAPYCPHLTHFLHMNHPQPYEKWLELDKEYLILCDAVYRFPGESDGADKEVELATEKGIPVFYTIEELINYLI